MQTKPYTVQQAPLPNYIIQETKTFEVTVVDFAGPLYEKTDNNNYSEAYIVLFTCGSTRAALLELSTGPTAEAYLLELQRVHKKKRHTAGHLF